MALLGALLLALAASEVASSYLELMPVNKFDLIQVRLSPATTFLNYTMPENASPHLFCSRLLMK